MPSTGRLQKSSLIAQLIHHAEQFDFFQACRLLIACSVPTADRHWPIRFVTLPESAFPKSEIAYIKPLINHPYYQWEVGIYFIGLIGVNGLLPPHFTMVVRQQLRRKKLALQDYLMLLQQRQIENMYWAWEKNQFPIHDENPLRKAKRDSLSQALLSFGGRNAESEETMGLSRQCLLKYASFFTRRSRSANHLVLLLTDYFATPVELLPFYGEWISLNTAQQIGLPTARQPQGQNNKLGSALLGRQVWSCHSTFQLMITLSNEEQLACFLPNGRHYRALRAWLACYLEPHLHAYLLLRVPAAWFNGCQLGEQKQGLLAWTTHLQANTRQAKDHYKHIALARVH